MGRAVEYAGLAHEIVEVILPGHFGAVLSSAERKRMEEVGGIYSKSRKDLKAFEGDSQDKQDAATQPVIQAAKR